MIAQVLNFPADISAPRFSSPSDFTKNQMRQASSAESKRKEKKNIDRKGAGIADHPAKQELELIYLQRAVGNDTDRGKFGKSIEGLVINRKGQIQRSCRKQKQACVNEPLQ